VKRWAVALAAVLCGCGSPRDEPGAGQDAGKAEREPAGPRGDIAFHLYKNPEDRLPHVSIFTPEFEQVDDGVLRLRDFRVVLRDEDAGGAEFIGAEAEYRQEEAVVMPGRVTLQSEAYRGYVEGLRWLEATGEAVSQGRVELASETNHVTAEGMRLDAEAGVITLENARGTIELGGGLR
jgi:hypothetical protein